MNIYAPIIITESIERYYKPTRLCIKELAGLQYFCKTTRKNIEKYTGSGTRWNNHIKKHGKDNIKTLWVSDWFYCPHHLQDFALMFSEYNKIVESDNWANLIAENGLTGMRGSKKGHMLGVSKPKSLDHRKSISNTLSGITLDERHGTERAQEIRNKMSVSKKGKKLSQSHINKMIVSNTGKKRSQDTIDRLIESRKHYKKYTCEYCNKITVPGNYHRWHGQKCKSKSLILKDDDSSVQS